jgi:hypothetical protein
MLPLVAPASPADNIGAIKTAFDAVGTQLL